MECELDAQRSEDLQLQQRNQKDSFSVDHDDDDDDDDDDEGGNDSAEGNAFVDASLDPLIRPSRFGRIRPFTGRKTEVLQCGM